MYEDFTNIINMYSESLEGAPSSISADAKDISNLDFKDCIYIFAEIDAYQAESVIRAILQAVDEGTKTLTLVIYSSGGSYRAAEAITDTIAIARRAGVEFRSLIIGYCCSVAMLVFLATSERFITSRAEIVLNKLTCKLGQDQAENMRRLKEMDYAQLRMNRRIDHITGSNALSQRLAKEDTIFLCPHQAERYGLAKVLR